MSRTIAFIGGGNMASAIIQGLRRQAGGAPDLLVVEPHAPTRDRLQAEFGLQAAAEAGPALARAELVVWAVKPQVFREAAAPCADHVRQALHLSVAAGIPSAAIARWLGSERIVRAMPNTPALIGRGIAGLYARAGVGAADRALVEQVMAATGESLWLSDESLLDAVTALSGSGPAYVFYFLEAMQAAGTAMGLEPQQAYRLAIATFSGAAELARASSETPQVLRERVTSRGGTTQAAITALEAAGVRAAFERAMQAARDRGAEMGREFGAG